MPGPGAPVCRLIPAHAGKTFLIDSNVPLRWAHPRSRGENPLEGCSGMWVAGSSPLTRGKPALGVGFIPGARLIPAHAGKTRFRLLGEQVHGAHPRSRGENCSA